MKEYIKQQIIGTAVVFIALMSLPLSLAILFHFLGV